MGFENAGDAAVKETGDADLVEGNDGERVVARVEASEVEVANLESSTSPSKLRRISWIPTVQFRIVGIAYAIVATKF